MMLGRASELRIYRVEGKYGQVESLYGNSSEKAGKVRIVYRG